MSTDFVYVKMIAHSRRVRFCDRCGKRIRQRDPYARYSGKMFDCFACVAWCVACNEEYEKGPRLTLEEMVPGD